MELRLLEFQFLQLTRGLSKKQHLLFLTLHAKQ